MLDRSHVPHYTHLVDDLGLTHLVDDLEDQVAALTQRGLSIGAIETVPGMVRKVVLIDPEGNRITLGEDLRTS